MNTTIRFPRAIALLAAAGLAASAAAEAQAGSPSGTYCGELLSAGVMSEVETSFQLNGASGTITGKYIFAEQGQPVEGLLAEGGDDGDRNDLTRTFIWRDKYGYGTLSMTFAPDFSEFAGAWTFGSSTGAPWTGRRCGLVSS
jgi:hypothetical protein